MPNTEEEDEEKDEEEGKGEPSQPSLSSSLVYLLNSLPLGQGLHLFYHGGTYLCLHLQADRQSHLHCCRMLEPDEKGVLFHGDSEYIYI